MTITYDEKMSRLREIFVDCFNGNFPCGEVLIMTPEADDILADYLRTSKCPNEQVVLNHASMFAKLDVYNQLGYSIDEYLHHRVPSLGSGIAVLGKHMRDAVDKTEYVMNSPIEMLELLTTNELMCALQEMRETGETITYAEVYRRLYEQVGVPEDRFREQIRAAVSHRLIKLHDDGVIEIDALPVMPNLRRPNYSVGKEN